MMKFCARLLVAAIPATALPALASAQESQFMSDLRREGEHIAATCSAFTPGALVGCAHTLLASYPFHVSLGSLAPGNGLAFGVSLSERYTPSETWRVTFSGDAVRSARGSNRVGGYVRFIHSPAEVGVVVSRPGDSPVRPRRIKLDTWAFDVFAQRTMLETMNYFGPGPDTLESDRVTFGQRQQMFGGSVVLPMSGASWLGALRPAVLGGLTRRNITLLPGLEADGPRLEDFYTDASAPGLLRQDPFVELREGIRLRPSLPNGRLQLDYRFTAQQFLTSTASVSSFRRTTIDLDHRIPIYRGSSATSGVRDFNGPNECAATVDSLECPPIQRVRDRSGSIGVRVIWSRSSTAGTNRVPFYLQRTLGGSDLNGDTWLAAYDDYRFRGAHVLLLQQSVEHSLWGPIGIFAMAEQGKAVGRRADLDLGDLKRSASIGVTVRAGGMPMITLSFAFGSEGRHVIASMGNSLLGGSSRPSLF